MQRHEQEQRAREGGARRSGCAAACFARILPSDPLLVLLCARCSLPLLLLLRTVHFPVRWCLNAAGTDTSKEVTHPLRFLHVASVPMAARLSDDDLNASRSFCILCSGTCESKPRGGRG